jgi:hypothetical protein
VIVKDSQVVSEAAENEEHFPTKKVVDASKFGYAVVQSDVKSVCH